jgi:sensitive to high expression protein 9
MGASSLPPSRPAAATPEALSSGRSSGTGKALSNPSSVSLEERVAVWRSQLATQSRQLAESAEKQFSLLGLRINEVTGYKEVERLKLLVAERGALSQQPTQGGSE